MLNKLLRVKRDQRGFTMVELMVVVVIIGILSAIAMPSFSGQFDRAKVGRTVAELKSMKNLVELYKIEHEKYPTTTEFQTLMRDNGFNGWGTDLKDPWDGAYYYYIDNDDEDLDTYMLWSDGPSAGSGDDIYVTQENNEPLKDQAKPSTDGMEESVSFTDPATDI